jgi:hypothetical protein
MIRPLVPALLLIALLTSGCSIQRIALRSIDGILDNAMLAMTEEEDLRLAEPAVASNLKLLDGLLKTDPENEKMLLLACQGYTSYALAFAGDSVARALLFYTRAQQYGVRCLRLRGLADTVFRSDPAVISRALESLSKDDVPIVFWTANAWASAINLQLENPDAVASLPSVNAMMTWVQRQDSTFYYGGPLLYFGVYYGSLPTIFGGKPELSKSYFDRALAISHGSFLMTYVFYARTYAVQVQDEALFEQLLTRVIQAPHKLLPEQRLANAVARERAQNLIARKSDFF